MSKTEKKNGFYGHGISMDLNAKQTHEVLGI